MFETYVVNGNNEEVKQAIENNGDVVVKFYNELATSTYFSSGSGTITISNPILTNNPYIYTTHNTLGNTSFTSTSTNTFYNASLTSGTINTNSLFNKESKSALRHVETGRVEKGSESNQVFTYDNSSFYSYPSQTNWWKIKPQSTKPVVREELVTYCTECGAKRKKDTHKFCPHCGTKF